MTPEINLSTLRADAEKWGYHHGEGASAWTWWRCCPPRTVLALLDEIDRLRGLQSRCEARVGPDPLHDVQCQRGADHLVSPYGRTYGVCDEHFAEFKEVYPDVP